MKALLVVNLIALSALSVFQQAHADTATIEKTLMQMERDWGQAAAKNDTAVLGQAVMNFFKDDSFYPMFKDGTKTGPDDDFFDFLVAFLAGR